MGEKVTFYCPRCWKEIPQGTIVCPHCHASIENSSEDAFLEKLIQSLQHPVPSKGALAAQILGNLGDPRAVEPLLKVLDRTPDPEIQEAAIRALDELRDVRAVIALVRFLEDAHAFVTLRVAAAEALGKIGGTQAMAALARAAQRDNRAPARAARAAVVAFSGK